MSHRGDHDTDMPATRQLEDDTIEAIIRGDAVPAAYAPLVSFAAHVRALGDERVPARSNDLVDLLEGRSRDRLRSVPPVAPARMRRHATRAGKVAGLGLAARLGLGTSLVAASVAGAGAAGMLPAAATQAVRHAIEAVTPVQFPSPDTGNTGLGHRVSSDATGESDGVKGVDGRTIADDAPGAANRPDPAVVDDHSQPGARGLGRANETPAAPHAPDSVPAHAGSTGPTTVPDHAKHGDPTQDGPGVSVASTVPPHVGASGDASAAP